MVRLISKPASEISTEVTASSVIDGELDNAEAFFEYVRK